MHSNNETYSDRQILALLKGSASETEKGFRILFDKYAKRLNAYCLRILSDRQTAEDIFQETFYRFYQNVRADIENGTIIGYLITIARNLCLNYKRDNKISEQVMSINDIELPSIEDDQQIREENIELVKMAIDMLELEYKEPLVLRVYNNMDYFEIASICGISEVNARSRVCRAKQKIRSILSPYLKEADL